MEDIFLSTEIDDRTVCMSPLTKKDYLSAGGKGLGGDFGYFLYEFQTDNQKAGIEILAKANSVDSAMRLFEILTSNRQVIA
ncbi:MAG: hypothetical protein Hens2KO_30730 [Henriciella sp.]